MTEKDKEFFEFLGQIPVRLQNKRKCDVFSELSDEEKESILSLQYTRTASEACRILKPIYQKYKGGVGKRKMPELVIRGIYFIIFRELTQIMADDRNRLSGKRLILSEDDKLRKCILPKCVGQIYQYLGEKNSKVQERLGIQPLKDFTMLNFEPVGFHVSALKDSLFREMFLNVIFCADNPMFVDLSGEDSILGDIYYYHTEVICCRDSITANFYYALQLKYKDFCKRAESMVRKMTGNIKEIVDKYQAEIAVRNMQDLGELKVDSNKAKKIRSSGKAVVLTYPLEYADIDLDLAVMYLVVHLDRCCKRSVEQLQDDIVGILKNQVGWLKLRLEKSIISWCGVEEMLEKIEDGNVSFCHLERKKGNGGVQLSYRPDFSVPTTKHYVYYENLKDTIEREGNELLAECRMQGLSEEVCQRKLTNYKKNKEARIKKGFLFYDYNVRKDKREAELFAQFVEKNECQWAFVCNRADKFWSERIKGDRVRIVEVDEKNPYSQYFWIRGYRDTIIITNVCVEKIIASRIRQLLDGFDFPDDALLNSLIKIRKNTGIEPLIED